MGRARRNMQNVESGSRKERQMEPIRQKPKPPLNPDSFKAGIRGAASSKAAAAAPPPASKGGAMQLPKARKPPPKSGEGYIP